MISSERTPITALPVARVRDYGELAVVIPHLLGYHPDESLVLLGRRDRRVGPIARHDLPAAGRPLPEDLSHLDLAIGRIAEAVPEAMIVSFEGYPGQSEALAARVRRRALAAGLDVLDVVRVYGRRWSVVVDGRTVARGKVPAEVDVPAVAEFLLDGSAPLPARTQVGALVRSVRGDVDRVADLLDGLRADPRGWRGVALGVGEPRLRDVDGVYAAWRAVLEPALPDGAGVPGGELDPAVVAAAVHGLDDLLIRDEIFGWLNSSYAVPRHQPDDQPDGRRDGQPDDRLGGGLPPDLRGRSVSAFGSRRSVGGKALVHRLLHLVQATPMDDRAPVLTGLGVCAWGTGDGTMAREALEAALTLEPEYVLADLLLTAVDVCLPLPAVRDLAG